MKIFLESTVNVLPQSFSFWWKWSNDLSSVLQLLVTCVRRVCVEPGGVERNHPFVWNRGV